MNTVCGTWKKFYGKISDPDGEIALKMYGIVRRALLAGQAGGRCRGAGSGPPQRATDVCRPLRHLDNFIHIAIGTSFCVPSGGWGGAKTDSLGR